MPPWGSMAPPIFMPYPFQDFHHPHQDHCGSPSSSKSRRNSNSSRNTNSSSQSPSPSASTRKRSPSGSPPNVDFPDLNTWIDSLAASRKAERAKVAEDCRYHVLQFHEGGFHTLSDILLVDDPKTLIEIAGITWPLANRILTIAAEDKAALVRAAKKRRM